MPNPEGDAMTLPAPAVAPYVPTYATKIPYLTRGEYLVEPTGVDVSQLVPGGSEFDNGAALDMQIASASSYADALCFQVLAATLDVQVGEYRIHGDGTIRVPVDYTPLVEVTNVNLGSNAAGMAALTDLSGLWIQRKTVRIPTAGRALSASPGSFMSQAAGAASGYLLAQVSYVNGYANTTIAGDVAAAAQSLVVDSALGIFPGLTLTIYDGAATETVTVAASYVQGSTTVPLLAPLLKAHVDGTAVSALPRAIKQAVICLVSHLIKTRGAESVAFSTVSGGPASIEKDSPPGRSAEYKSAVDLLKPFRRAQ
jgi:hypothetical protein